MYKIAQAELNAGGLSQPKSPKFPMGRLLRTRALAGKEGHMENGRLAKNTYPSASAEPQTLPRRTTWGDNISADGEIGGDRICFQ